MRRRLPILAAVLSLATFASMTSAQTSGSNSTERHLGFDRNLYPGDAALPALRQHFAFTGYWLNNPPGETSNTWTGKRQTLADKGFGFLVLFNGRLDADILHQLEAHHTTPSDLGRHDAQAAIQAAAHEGFPTGTILFLDQEEGGRLLPEQAHYVFAWTEAVAASHFRPGLYLSGQPVPDSPGKTISTAQDVRQQIATRHLQPIALFVYQDACPPSNGCTLTPPPIARAGTPEIDVWQYAQSPRRPEITRACAKTYAHDNQCYAPDLPGLFLDMDTATSDDPSHGR
jgi:hypothetical protein